MPQLDLFQHDPPDSTRQHSGRAVASRMRLDARSWVDHEPGWLAEHEALFDALRRGMQWRAERRAMFDTVIEVPRLTATIPDDGPCPPALERAHGALERRYRRRFESIRLAWYRDGRDSVAMHGDRIGRRIADTVVAILSLGAPRRFLLKPATGGRALRFDLGGGDLLVMGGACQRTWRHGIPKVRSAGPRISIQLRESREYA
ncbi:MAG: alpha-ketoglutarate-dependent dioxygenase AlkB [Immundisolibacterales bacterium]|nr:alpha-ketoglutarate-dependent dioxygenase AlkB [Immundisolibacterales bacterium]